MLSSGITGKPTVVKCRKTILITGLGYCSVLRAAGARPKTHHKLPRVSARLLVGASAVPNVWALQILMSGGQTENKRTIRDFQPKRMIGGYYLITLT